MSEAAICLKQYINDHDYQKIEELKNLCIEKEDMFLKLELDYKLNAAQIRQNEPFQHVNEFLYYCDDTLAGYIGICNFGGEAAELTGMVHPSFRRKGIFTKLYNLAKEECKRRNFKNILLVCDNKASSGQEFIKSTEAVYSFSEYEMSLEENYVSEDSKNIVLRKASNNDAEELARQNNIYFGDVGRTLIMPEEEEKRNRITYMVELNSKVIGKIRIDFSTDEGFISGFGILPEYRGKGYGREAIKAALYILNKNDIHKAALEVAAQNKNALSLYKSCGFAEMSVTDYFEDK